MRGERAMKFAITTSRGLFVYDYDADSVTPVPRGTPQEEDDSVSYAFGISWTQQHFYAAWRRPDEIIEYDKELKPTGRVISQPDGPDALGDIHQILCRSGKIWATCCGYNRIHVYDAATLKLDRSWNPAYGQDDAEPGKASFYEGSYLGKYKHWNSIRIVEDKLYLLAHMYDCPPSKVWEFSFPELEFRRKIPGGECAHNIFFYDGKLNILDSKNGRICQPEIGLCHGFFDRSPFFRGVSQVGDKIAIGFSGQCLDARKRPSTPGGLIFLDRCDPMAYEIRFNGVGPIMDIRCLDAYDSAHGIDPFWELCQESCATEPGSGIIPPDESKKEN